MSSLEWHKLVDKFYAFKYVADKLGFYNEELNHMEKSLEDLQPYEGSLEERKRENVTVN